MPATALSRRLFLAAATTMPWAAHAQALPFDAIEARIGGRVGVAAINTATGAGLFHRADERFAMCSTFKWVLAAAILSKVDQGALTLDKPVTYTSKDLFEYAPITKEHVKEGLSIEALCEAAVELSDNTAANLLLAHLGGPKGVTAFARSAGDKVTRLDRTELSLNTNLPHDPRDTTSPRAMVGLLQKVLLGNVLKDTSRAHLLDWMKKCETGTEMLRKGLPQGWDAGDKTGRGANGAVNDVAIVFPPGRAPILIASYLSESKKSADELNAAHAEIGKTVAAAFG